jgi:serine/threonine protein kinase
VSETPQRIDRYVLERELGRGASGTVYRATHAVMRRAVALKVLHSERTSSPAALERFLGEARAAAAIGSPNIVQVFDAGVAPDQRAFVAMELLEGEDLAACLARSGRLSPGRAIEIGRGVCRGLADAHAAGIVHRDLKPANLFLVAAPSGPAALKILDFGVSKTMHADGTSLTVKGAIVGTPQYMAPEQFSTAAPVDARADLYSVGAVLYEALTGVPPHAAPNVASLIAAKLTEPPRPLGALRPDIPAPLAAVVHRLLAIDPSERFASAVELDAALGALAGPVVPAPGAGAAASLRPEPQPGAVAATVPPLGAPPARRSVEDLPGIVNATRGAAPGTTSLPFARLLVIALVVLLVASAVVLLGGAAIAGFAFFEATRTSELAPEGPSRMATRVKRLRA